MIVALYVETNGAYFGLDGVDPWDITRNAMFYEGPHPVVAHPPCSRWCRLAGLVEARWGHKRGDDGGTFAHALDCVRRFGGVLEHPAWSKAWPAFGLPNPPREGWQRTLCGGWVCHVEQGRYGHAAKKATWLYAVGAELPALRWGQVPDAKAGALVSWCGNKVALPSLKRPIVGRTHRETPRGQYDERPRLSSRDASATPPEFLALLIAMARSVRRSEAA